MQNSGASRRGNADACHCEEQRDEAIQLSSFLAQESWIASLALAMTVLDRATLSTVIARHSRPKDGVASARL
jgi:hypothetical protein